MARTKDLWFSEVPVRDPDGKPIRGADGRVVKQKRKTAKHPDRGGNRDAKRWLAVWLDPDGNEVTKAFATQAAAKKYGAKMEGDAERDEYVDPKAGKAKTGQLAQTWIRFRNVTAGTRERYDRVYRNQIAPVFGERGVRGVKPSEIVEWLRSPEIAGLSATTRNAALMILAGAFDVAVADKMLRDNPARSDIVPWPSQGEPDRELWPVEKVWAVIDAHPEEYRIVPVLEAGAGLRRGCAFAVAEDDFNFEEGKIEVRRQIARVGNRFYFKLPKGGKTRTVPMSRGVASFAEGFIRKFPPVEVTLPWMNEDGSTGGPVTVALVAVWRGGGPRARVRHLSNGYDQRVWKPALSAAGIIPPPVRDRHRLLRYYSGGRGNGEHALRHFFSNVLQDGGVPPAGAMDFMGHSRKRLPVTFRVYGHVTEETFEMARQAVDRTLFKLRPAPSSGTVTELRVAQ